MFNEIVVGVGEEPSGRDAIALGWSLIAQGGRLTVAHVLTTAPYVYRGASARYAAARQSQAMDRSEEERARSMLEHVAEEACLAEAGHEFTLRVVQSATVGQGLHELGEVERADLLVVGSSHNGLLGRVLIGDDTRAALNGAPCAVAIAPAGFSEQRAPFREIGVGYDGSAEGTYALEVARGLATALGVRLSAFTAVSMPISAFGPGSRPASGAIVSRVRDARERIEALGGVEAHAAYGDAVEELTLYSASLDLLVVGSRGYGPIGRLIHGSTSAQLARTARCALLVVPGSRARRQADFGRAAVVAAA
jgi:nucleotide-binding universal stress UspA family protein